MSSSQRASQPQAELSPEAVKAPALTPEELEGFRESFAALERAALRPDVSGGERAKVVELLCEGAVRAMPQLALRRDVQDAVDVAVALVDVALKVGHESALDRALTRIDPETLPPEVILAFLTASKAAATRLPARAGLVSRFERAIRARRRPDTDALLRFAR